METDRQRLFVEMPWGRFARITIEYLADLGDSIEEVSEYMDFAMQQMILESQSDTY
jgi:hypothetical protein